MPSLAGRSLIYAVTLLSMLLASPGAAGRSVATAQRHAPSAVAQVGRYPEHSSTATLQHRYRPFDPAPEIVLPTKRGELKLGGATPSDVAYVLLGRSEESDLALGIWDGSVAELIQHSPDDVHYVFMSYAADEEDVAADIEAMQAKVDTALAALPDDAARQAWSARFHFVTENPRRRQAELKDLLERWGPVFADVSAAWQDAQGAPRALETRGTTDKGWAKSLIDTGAVVSTLASYGSEACGDEEPLQDLQDRIALIPRGTCAFTVKAANAEKNGALAALLYTTADRPKVAMLGQCDPCPEIPVAMIDHQQGVDLRSVVESPIPVTVTLDPVIVGAEYVAIDRQSRLREAGSLPFPFPEYLENPIGYMHQVSFGPQYLHYEHERDSRLKAEEAAGVVTVADVFEGEWAPDPSGDGRRSYAEVELPDAARMATFDTLEVELALSCADHWYYNCPAWDYIVDLFLCREDEPDTCDILVGRWITPYWSEGHWVTDISPLIGLLAGGGTRRFAFYTQQTYEVDLSLRFSARETGSTPRLAYDLGLNGGAFWKDYNDLFEPVFFEVPEWAEKVELASYITGHGFGRDKENCAEFCNHTHHISVNRGPEHVKAHPEVEDELGCARQVPEGVVPNQGGTWVFGRGGWCPGLDVQPWIIDITDEVTVDEINRLTYRGLFDGEEYVAEKAPDQDPNERFDANIRMRSYLVYSAREGVAAEPPPSPWMRVGLVKLPFLANGIEERPAEALFPTSILP